MCMRMKQSSGYEKTHILVQSQTKNHWLMSPEWQTPSSFVSQRNYKYRNRFAEKLTWVVVSGNVSGFYLFIFCLFKFAPVFAQPPPSPPPPQKKKKKLIYKTFPVNLISKVCKKTKAMHAVSISRGLRMNSIVLCILLNSA